MEGLLARSVILYSALALSILFQDVALRLRAQERSAWWASNGRDVANALAAGLLLLAIRWGAGAPWHIALLIGATITLFLTALARALHEQMERPWRVVALAGIALMLPVALDPEGVGERTQGLVNWLFGP